MAEQQTPWQGFLGRLTQQPQDGGVPPWKIALMHLATNLPAMTGQGQPNNSLIAGYMASKAQRSTNQRDTNRTAEFLRSRGRDDLADAVLSGYDAKDAYKQAFSQPEKDKLISVGDGRLYDPNTGQWLTAPEDGSGPGGMYDKEQFDQYNVLSDNYRQETAYYRDALNAFQNVETAISTRGHEGGAVNDYALAVAFAKLVDPGSVAREGEVAAVQKTAGALPGFAANISNIVTGQGAFTPAQRRKLYEMARRKAEEVQGTLSSTQQRYGGIADRQRLRREDIFEPFSLSDPIGLDSPLFETDAESGGKLTAPPTLRRVE